MYDFRTIDRYCLLSIFDLLYNREELNEDPVCSTVAFVMAYIFSIDFHVLM